MTTPEALSVRRIVAVVGMHRSGTSMTMQGLDLLGAQPGGMLIEGDEFNQRGYWEAAEIVAFHDDLLFEMGRPWGTPAHALGVPPGWFDTERAAGAAARATDLLRSRLDKVGIDRMLALKDPRMSFFLPLWQAAAEKLNAQLSLICCLRHPAEVAASLARRDGIGAELANVLWTSYQVAVLRDAGDLPLLLLPFSAWRDAPQQTSDRVARFLGLPGVADTVFAADLTTSLPLAVPEDAITKFWWEKLSEMAAEGDECDPTDEVARYHGLMLDHVSPVTDAIRAELGNTPTAVLLRDLDNFRQGYADLQKLRHGDQDWIAQQRQSLKKVQSDLSIFHARVQEMEQAYQDSARQAERFQQAYQIEAAERQRFQQAYQDRLSRGEKLAAKLGKLQPWAWFFRK